MEKVSHSVGEHSSILCQEGSRDGRWCWRGW